MKICRRVSQFVFSHSWFDPHRTMTTYKPALLLNNIPNLKSNLNPVFAVISPENWFIFVADFVMAVIRDRQTEVDVVFRVIYTNLNLSVWDWHTDSAVNHSDVSQSSASELVYAEESGQRFPLNVFPCLVMQSELSYHITYVISQRWTKLWPFCLRH